MVDSLENRSVKIDTFVAENDRELEIRVARANETGYRVLKENLLNPVNRINEAHVRELHTALMSYKPPAVREVFRQGHPGDYIGYRQVVNGEYVQGKIPLSQTPPGEIVERFSLACRWLEEEAEEVKKDPENLIPALKLASEVQYVFTYPEGHFFSDGNGRLSRWLSNEVVILNAEELKHGHFIMPFPWLRHKTNGFVLPEDWKDDPYLIFLRSAYQDRTLNPLDVYLAQMWSRKQKAVNQYFETELIEKFGIGQIPETDIHLLDKFRQRVITLDNFINEQRESRDESHIAPDFLEV